MSLKLKHPLSKEELKTLRTRYCESCGAYINGPGATGHLPSCKLIRKLFR